MVDDRILERSELNGVAFVDLAVVVPIDCQSADGVVAGRLCALKGGVLDTVIVVSAVVVFIQEQDPVGCENEPAGMTAVFIQPIGFYFGDGKFTLGQPVVVDRKSVV